MPNSVVIEMKMISWTRDETCRPDVEVKFGASIAPQEFKMDGELWETLGKPTGLRVRIEDTFNDPDRDWGFNG